MNDSFLEKDNILFSCASDVNEICKPLRKYFDIGSFTYLKIFPDMSRIHLDTDPDWGSHFYSQVEKYHETYMTEACHWESGCSPLLKLGDACIEDSMAHGRGEGVAITNHQEGCTEMVFITHDWSIHRDNKLPLLLRNIDLIEKFIEYFKEAAKGIIEEASKSPIIYPFLDKRLDIKSFPDNHAFRQEFLSEITGRSTNAFTAKETECIYHTSLGMSAKEVARQLGVSPRTVERHLENAKHKLGVTRKTALVDYLAKKHECMD